MTVRNRPRFLAAIAAILLAACSQPSTDTPSGSVSASLAPASGTPQATLQPSETAAPTPTASEGASTWSVAESFKESGTAATVRELVAWNEGFVAIGERTLTEDFALPGEPRVWLSPDGRAWQETVPALGHDHAAVVGGSVLDDGRVLLIGGSGGASPEPAYQPRAWVSADAVTWTELALPFGGTEPVGYAGGPLGHLVTQGSLIWFSSNGSDWDMVLDAGDESFIGPAAGDEGFVVTRVDDTHAQSTTMASGDGVQWFEGDSRPIFGVASFGGDWLGFEYSSDPATIMLSRSANGLDWEAYQDVNDLTPADGPKAGKGMESEITQVQLTTTDGLAVLVLGWNHCCAQLPVGVMVLTSPDGITWTEVDLGEVGSYVTSAAGSGDQYVLGGYVDRGAAVTFWNLEP